jgi:translation initiation factor 6
MGIYQTEFFGNGILGLLGVCTENMCYLPPEVPQKQVERVSQALQTSTQKVVLYNSYLIGLFASANSNYFFVPEGVTSKETVGITNKKVIQVNGVFNTLGNLMLCNDHGCVLSPYLKLKKAYFHETLGLKTSISTVSDLPFPGIGACATNSGCIVHHKCLDSEMEIIEKALGVPVRRAESYDGFPGAEILANSKGLIVPKTLKGHTLSEIQEALRVF